MIHGRNKIVIVAKEDPVMAKVVEVEEIGYILSFGSETRLTGFANIKQTDPDVKVNVGDTLNAFVLDCDKYKGTIPPPRF